MTSTKTLLFLKIESGSKKRQKAPKPCVKHQILSGFRANYYRISRKRKAKFELLHCYSSGTFLFLEIESGSKVIGACDWTTTECGQQQSRHRDESETTRQATRKEFFYAFLLSLAARPFCFLALFKH